MRNGSTYAWILFSFAPLALSASSNLNDHWSVLGEFVYMKRTDVHNRALVENADKFQCPGRCPDFVVIDTENLVHDFGFEPGYRVGLTYTSSPKNSFEGIFLYLKPWTGTKTKHGNGSLSFPFKETDYSQDFTDADEAHAKYNSHFWDAELNYWRHFTPRKVNYFSLSGIIGLRYFNLDEAFKLSMVKSSDKSTYNIHTKNRIGALQLGLDLQVNPTRWLSWDVFAKAGPFANYTRQKQFLGDLDNTVTLRRSKRHKWESGIYADVAAQIGFRCWEHLLLHGGYEFMFFSGLSLAPEQVSRRVSHNAGKKDYTHGNAIIHGLFAGITFSF